ncbi:MAG: hypothetical protein HY860_04090 [Chlamydiales bacterium]|nr:hypothetical protein [Chlamydiales bacterium]
MRLVYWLLLIGIVIGGSSYYIQKKKPQLKSKITQFANAGKVHTLEARYTPEQIMESHEKELLKDEDHRFLTPEVKFYPYLLLEVKYTTSNNLYTGEGIILWDLIDGEMVTSTRSWDKTHGFQDCIKAGVDKSEFKILNLLARRGGAIDREGLSKALNIENDILDAWIDNCRKKKLIVQSGNQYRLHLQSPKINVVPETHIADRLVTKQLQNGKCLQKRFSANQIKKIAYAAFGQDFAIRNTIMVYLPICSITVQNPDGSIHTSYWNALNGQELAFSSLIE